MHGLWNLPDANGVTVFFRRCTVISFGAKQGAFRDADDNTNVRHRIYANQYAKVCAGHGPNTDIVAALVAEQVAHCEAKIAWYDADPVRGARAYSPKTVEGWKDALAALLAGRVKVSDYESLVSSVSVA